MSSRLHQLRDVDLEPSPSDRGLLIQVFPPRFRTNDRVRLRAEPAKIGVILGDPLPYGSSHAYLVFFSADDCPQVNEAELEPLEREDLHVLPRDAFLRALLLAKVQNPLTDLLYAYEASRTQSEAYQFKPVLKFLESPASGILIADEVGLGKTIEAAIIHQELSARETIRRVLIVCPAGLRDKWQMELATRFDEQFTIMRTSDIRRDLEAYRQTGGMQALKGIVGLETIRAREVQALYDEFQVTYDLVIIDEAHHLRTSGRLSNRIGERLTTLADHRVLLTATPLQTDRMDLFNLLQFVDDTQFTTFEDFVQQLEPNALLNEAIRALRSDPPAVGTARRAIEAIPGLQAAEQVTGHPNFEPVLRRLRQPEAPDREAIVHLQRDIDQMNVLSSVYTRTKKSDVTGVAKRKAFVIPVPLDNDEREFYAAVLAHARAEAAAQGKVWIAGFTGMMRERQAASCMAATREYFEGLGRNVDELEIEAFETEASMELEEGLQVEPMAAGPRASEEVAFARVLAASRRIGTRDTKLDTFVTTMREALSEANGGKAIVFSYFRRTLRYLERALRANGFNVIVIHGDVKPEQRKVLIDTFKERADLQIMLTSEVGAEGLDFQFCDTLVNYDLPWNPMKVEQRIGRIDRYGQQRPQIRIYSFVLQGTVEERILARLYDRIGIFEESIGDLEPILGPAVADLTREVFTADLTPDEEAAVLERNLRMVVQRRLEEQLLDKRRAELLGQDALLKQRIDETVSSGRYISAAELRAAVDGYLREIDSKAELRDRVGDGRTCTLHGDAVLVDRVGQHMMASRDTRPSSAQFLSRLGGRAPIPGTFDGVVAHQGPRLELFSLRHPLLRAAVDHLRAAHPTSALPIVDLLVDLEVLPQDEMWPDEGAYAFVLFLLGVSGVQRQSRLVPVVFNAAGERAPSVEDRLLRLVQDATSDRPNAAWSGPQRDDLVGRARLAMAGIADAVQAEARERNEGWLVVRRATLERTLRGKIAKRRALEAEATDDRIRRMRRSEAANLEHELTRRLAEVERLREVAAQSTIIGAGRLECRRGPLVQAKAAVPSVSRPFDAGGPISGFPEPPRILS